MLIDVSDTATRVAVCRAIAMEGPDASPAGLQSASNSVACPETFCCSAPDECRWRISLGKTPATTDPASGNKPTQSLADI
jgi:hypothetical protein